MGSSEITGDLLQLFVDFMALGAGSSGAGSS